MADTLIRTIERHCNNYFNPQNTPENPDRNYPDDFLELVERIRAFIESPQGKPSTLASERFAEYSFSNALGEKGVPVTWQQVFASDLSIFKRANFI